MSTTNPSGPTNRLSDETSAYLRQHMRNPVDWYPWGDEAFARARDEDKPVIVSIGYSACHWCHVMEHESFEDADTAALMNRLFVSVKVDREERPDVDQIYMDTVTRLTGHGGWPLTVFCTPAGEPFYGGTYFPPEPRHGLPSFRQILESVDRVYRERRGEVQETASRILAALAEWPTGSSLTPLGAPTLAQSALRLLQRADPDNGGFGTAPKFPTPVNLDLLLAAVDVLPERKAQEALDHVLLTCRRMARSGTYDQLGGGFHRYSVDARWAVPHFEKMLYDQGQLLRVYAEAWRRCGDDDLLWPIHETAAFLRRELAGPEGGFFASQDADSEGEEGRFYVWTPGQVEAVLGAERSAAFCEVYGVTPRGNFEGGATVLADGKGADRAALAHEREELRSARDKRIAPGTDRKRVAGWNALAASGLARAGSLLDDATLLAEAAAAADFVLEKMVDAEGRLLRVFDAGRARVTAFLEDHAALLEACLDLHRGGAGSRYLEAALRLADEVARRFFDSEAQDLFLTAADGDRLVHRPRQDHDGAMPHSAGLATLGLLRAAHTSGREDLRAIADAVLRSHALHLERAPEAYPTLSRAALLAERGLSLVLVAGEADDPAAATLALRARRVFPPDAAIVTSWDAAHVDPGWLEARGPIDGRPAAYVCRGVTCSLPILEPGELLA